MDLTPGEFKVLCKQSLEGAFRGTFYIAAIMLVYFSFGHGNVNYYFDETVGLAIFMFCCFLAIHACVEYVCLWLQGSRYGLLLFAATFLIAFFYCLATQENIHPAIYYSILWFHINVLIKWFKERRVAAGNSSRWI